MWIITSPSVSTLMPALRIPTSSGGLAIAIPHGPGVPYYYNSNCWIAPTELRDKQIRRARIVAPQFTQCAPPF
jgi:hypothetical protein